MRKIKTIDSIHVTSKAKPGILLVQAQNAYPLANQCCCFKLITFTHLNMSLVELCNSVSHEASV